MPLRRPLVFERERSAFFSAVVEEAYREALRCGLRVNANEHEVRMMLGGRIIRAIESGETDIERLRVLALGPDSIRLSSRNFARDG